MLVGFKLNNFPFPGALTYIISFDHHLHPCKCRGSRHRARQALATGAGRAHTVRDRNHLGWGQLKQVEEVILDKDVLQMAIRSANIGGSAVQMCPRVTH